MKAIKGLGSALTLLLACAPALVFSSAPRTGLVPDGFLGVPWGAKPGQVVKAMKERGYRQLKGAGEGQLVFKGAFSGERCQLTFRFLANSLHSASANFIGRSGQPAGPQFAFTRIVQDLTDKYGPPTHRGSGKLTTNDGKDHPQEGAAWNLVDERTSDRYDLLVDFGVTWFADDTGDQYVVNVSYGAVSLGERLKKQEY